MRWTRIGLAALAVAMGAAGQAQEQAQDQARPPAGQPWRIFFDWSKPEIRGDYDAALTAAAEAWRAAPGAMVRLDGHSDRSGGAAGNVVSSRRRAEAVRARLVSLGVPGPSIRVVAFGEETPLVPTEDGVREVQNRRVDIWIMPAQSSGT